MAEGCLYRIDNDRTSRKRWLLNIPMTAELLPLQCLLTVGQRVEHDVPIPLEVVKQGPRVDIHFSTPMGVAIVSSRVAEILEARCADEVQFLPIRNDQLSGEYKVLNITSRIDCLDESRSQFSNYRGPGDFDYVFDITIDFSRAKAGRIFRLATWPAVVIASEEVRTALVAASATGAVFETLRVS